MPGGRLKDSAMRFMAVTAMVPPMEAFETIPWAVIRGGKTLRGGVPVPLGDIWPVLDQALDAHGKALLWDMDGIETNRPQLDLLRRFEGLGLWVDAGVRYADGVIDVLVAGADKAVVGTKSLWGLEELQEAFRLTENLLLQIDFNGKILHPGRAEIEPVPQDLARWVRDHGGDTILFMTADAPIDLAAVKSLASEIRVYAGVATAEQVPALKEAGAAGAIVDLWEADGRTI